MIHLTHEDFNKSSKFLNEIVDNTEINDIENKIENLVKDYKNNNKRKEFLVHLNNLFFNVFINEKTWREKESINKAKQGMFITKKLSKL